jgi:predicted nucleic acid-binding protein
MAMPVECLLLDSGVWIASRTVDERFNRSSLELVMDARRPAAALDLTLYEIANVVGVRRHDLRTLSRLFRSIEMRCRKSIVAADPDLLEASSAIALEHSLTIYDAAYVAVARLHAWTLVSTDVKDLSPRASR